MYHWTIHRISQRHRAGAEWDCLALMFYHSTNLCIPARLCLMVLKAGCASPRVLCRSRYQLINSSTSSPKKTKQKRPQTQKKIIARRYHTRNHGNVLGATVENAGSQCRSLSRRNTPRFNVIRRRGRCFLCVLCEESLPACGHDRQRNPILCPDDAVLDFFPDD